MCNVCNNLINSDSSSTSFGSLIVDGSASGIGGVLINSSSVSNSNCDETISLRIRFLMLTANSNPTANNTNNKMTANCIVSGCSCNVCGAHLPSTKLIPSGHCLSVMKSSGFWNSSGVVIITGSSMPSPGRMVAVLAEMVVITGVASMTNDFTNAVADTCSGPLSANNRTSYVT